MYKPVSYLQTDPRWKYNDYSTKGEKTTIGASGCGPTAMSMVLATWADPKVTPATECAWALAHGYKALKQGTYYGYFVPAGKRYGLKVRQLNTVTIYGNASTIYHEQARQAIKDGHLVIACMGPGNWTSSGHYVLVYDIDGDLIRINDPASTLLRRVAGSYALFKQQVKFYWVIEHPPVKAEPKKEDGLDMTIDEFISKLTPEQAASIMSKAQQAAGQQALPEWFTTEWQRAQAAGLTDGKHPEQLAKRDEVAAMIVRAGVDKMQAEIDALKRALADANLD